MRHSYVHEGLSSLLYSLFKPCRTGYVIYILLYIAIDYCVIHLLHNKRTFLDSVSQLSAYWYHNSKMIKHCTDETTKRHKNQSQSSRSLQSGFLFFPGMKEEDMKKLSYWCYSGNVLWEIREDTPHFNFWKGLPFALRLDGQAIVILVENLGRKRHLRWGVCKSTWKGRAPLPPPPSSSSPLSYCYCCLIPTVT